MKNCLIIPRQACRQTERKKERRCTMIVRILNKEKDSDKFYDCRNTCVRGGVGKEGKETHLDIEFTSGQSIEIILAHGDAIYYMNEVGKTIHSDCKML